MKLKHVYDLVDSLAPFALSREYCEKHDGYDNSGILLDCGKDVTDVMFSLDLSPEAAARAKAAGADCIVTHHPAIYSPLHALRADGEGAEMLACAQCGISVVSAHLNLDCARGGIDDCLMRGLGGERAEATLYSLTDGGYGKVFRVEEQDFSSFVSRVQDAFCTARTVAYGSGRVKKVASFCGAGTDEDTVKFALEQGADTFVSSEGKHHHIAALIGRGLNVLMLTHYAAEQYGFSRFYENMKKILSESGVRAELFTDERFL